MRLGAHKSCPGAVRNIQRFHQQTRGWADIAYNFLICPHGVVFVGRGWGRRSAANGTNAGNTWGHAVMVMVGTGETIGPAVFGSLATLHLEHRRLYGRSLLRTHRSFKSTDCPGPTLTGWVTLNPNPTLEDDEMNDAERAKLDQAARDAADAKANTVKILEAIGDRAGFHSMAADVGRVRRGVRGVLDHLGVKVKDGP